MSVKTVLQPLIDRLNARFFTLSKSILYFVALVSLIIIYDKVKSWAFYKVNKRKHMKERTNMAWLDKQELEDAINEYKSIQKKTKK